MHHRIIFFEGPPGSGKSSLSQFVSQQLNAAQIPSVWLEEHTLNDSTFEDFFETIDSHPSRAISVILECWSSFLETVHTTDAVYCLDGAFFHSTLKLLFAHEYDSGQIAQYQQGLYALLEPFKPSLIHITGDVSQIMRAIIAERGEHWSMLVAEDVAEYPCQQHKNLKGVEGLIEFFIESQRQFDVIAKAYPFASIRIDTTDRNWKQYQQNVCQWLDIPLQQEQFRRENDVKQYAGIYQTPAEFPPDFNHPFEVEHTPDGLRLHMKFMRNFRLIEKVVDKFEIASRPLMLEFVRNEQAKIIGAIYPFVPNHRFFCPKID